MHLLYDDVAAAFTNSERGDSTPIILNAFLIFTYLMALLIFASFLTRYGAEEENIRLVVIIALIKIIDMPFFFLWAGLMFVGRYSPIGFINRWAPIATGILFTIFPFLPASDRFISGLGMMVALTSGLFILIESMKMSLAQKRPAPRGFIGRAP